MSLVFQNIDPQPPSLPGEGECVLPSPLVRGEDTPAGWRKGWGRKAVNREDKPSRRYRDRDIAKFESSRRYRQR